MTFRDWMDKTDMAPEEIGAALGYASRSLDDLRQRRKYPSFTVFLRIRALSGRTISPEEMEILPESARRRRRRRTVHAAQDTRAT